MNITRIKELLFRNRGTRQTIAKNVFWLSIGQVATRLIRSVIIIYAARILGASEYGVFSYLLGLAGFFTIFSDIGVNQILTREISQRPDHHSKYFSTGFWIKIILFLATSFLIIFIAPHFSKMAKATTLINFVALIVIFDGLREFCAAIFRAKEKMELETLTTVLTNAAITILGFVALYFSATSQSLTLSYVISTGIGALAAVIILRKDFGKIIANFDKNFVKPIIVSALPTAMLGILGAFMLNTDVIMLGLWRTAQEIGFYSAGQKIIMALYSLPAILASAIFPTLSRLIGQKNNEKIKQLLELNISASLLVAIPLTVGGIILAKPLIQFVYGQEYLPAVPVLQILIATSLIIFPAIIISNSLLAYRQQKKMAIYSAIAALSNIAFNAILIPIYGIVGSSIATICSQFLSGILSWRLIKKLNNFETLRYLKKIIIGSLIMGFSNFIFNKMGINVFINIILSIGIYAGVLYLLKEKILEEIKIMIKLAKKN